MTAKLELTLYSFEDKQDVNIHVLEEIFEYEPHEKKKKQKQKPINYYLN